MSVVRYVLVLYIILSFGILNAQAQDHWEAPAEADTLSNPYSLDDAEIIEKGSDLYVMLCASCHGAQGDGQGSAGQSSNPPPADFTKEKVQQQSDGALFWKIWEGNPPAMLSYKRMLDEEEVWQIVTYLREFNPNENE